jgi:hypothetical protein
MSSAKPLVFISYAHLDEPESPAPGEVRWLSFVMKFLRPAVKSGEFAVWDDREMPGGTKWNPKIERNLRACDIFVLLVSANSMASSYIISKELEIARELEANDEIVIYPLLIEPTPKAGLDRVRDFNLRPRDAKPFQSYPLAERNQHMSDAADEIAGIADKIAARKGATRTEPKPQAPAYAHISGLPETGYERLVGRGAELKRLNEAWSDDKTNILSLVAEGGAGKSALVNELLKRLQADGYRGADCVLGWSFYSQGSKERATADEFLNWALAKLDLKVETTSASAKGDAIAEALMARRVLLVLDGVEPLQQGPGPQAGQLKDQGLRALLRRFAAAPPRAGHSLIVLSSRLAVADIKRFEDLAAPVIDVERLSDEAGGELLRDNDVWGIDKELTAASHEFGGHPLALTLLASLIKETQNGDVRRRDHIRSLLADADNPRHDQARRVMETYEKEWLAGQPALLAILHCVGLFDRPASGDCLKALRAKPTIRGLSDGLVGLSNEQWRRAVERLRDVRLLAPRDAADPDALDAHPLVREWFGERLKQTNEVAWKAAHSRLYDHLRRTAREGEKPTVADLAPLYHATVHGCRAGRQQEALVNVYMDRICRRLPDGKLEFYSSNKLGAMASDLAAISSFFDPPFETPVVALTSHYRGWISGEAGFGLRAQGRLQEALPAMALHLRLAQEEHDWANAARTASNISETELLVGNIAAATASADRAIAHGDQDGEKFLRLTRADALHAGGQLEEPKAVFADVERQQRDQRPRYPILFSMAGYRYCDLLLSLGRASEAYTLQISRSENWPLFIGLDTLTLGRAHLALALRSLPSGSSAVSTSAEANAASAALGKVVEGLRASGEQVWIARGHLARAAFRRALGDWDGAGRDLDEAEEIAEAGPMRLHLCDCALERARLALAQVEAVAPPTLPVPDAAAALKADARTQLDVARKLIAECGYHRRDEELAELDDVVAGRRRFIDLVGRV